MNFLTPKLHISEHFESIQGEGKTAGHPAIFWRFKGCVLQCVWCDTIEVWKKGTAYTYEEAYSMFSEAGYFANLNKGTRVLIITGGDPLIQQEKIAEFLLFCQSRGENVGNWKIEVENQGSILPKPIFANFVSQWNISPKMSNSGMPEDKRIVPAVIDYLVRHNSTFKFPVANEKDVEEVKDYVRRFGIHPSRVYLMPVASTREQHEIVGREVVKLCLTNGYRFSPRLHLALWNLATGV